jgi:nucleoside-diphosphate-sugar epimerase
MERPMKTQMTTKSGLVVVFGYGPTGEATVGRLRARGQKVRVVQRRRPANLAPGVEFQTCDVLDADDVLSAMRSAEQAVVTIGFEYKGSVWKTAWPKAMANFIAAAEATGARVVHIDNLYMYGPQTAPLREDMPLTSYGRKPSARAEATRMWMKASEEKRILWAALRAPDFYGPGVGRSHIGDVGFGMVAKGKPATLLMQPDTPHAFAYVPDIARAVLSLLDADNDAYGQAWHVPCAPTLTPRQILKFGADALGTKLRIVAIPGVVLQALGVFAPYLREMAEMSFTWNRPYHVDSTKFARRFWSDATPFEVGARVTALAFGAVETAPVSMRNESVAV